MPKSRSDRKKKAVYTPPVQEEAPRVSPPWFVPVMLAPGALGILWIVVFYITGGQIPVLDQLGNWNLLVGFGGIIATVLMSTRWH
ncbi:cell division protein CrgA [Lipingzhangella sp. LS1_29]|uniref:Cell division protein CrgA n=1 Tax=Lipingzhangella rawalii TaxID=2055835 RepID=A0ABU2H8L6_9ACTN|nr:cell division protein CrgA [Lipingzhangella rawalii]MDS1271651.1 cell division protein CrgA [Lipingzhangella rawalii]